jgi:hypothetical protein
MPVVEALLLSRFAKQSFADKHSQRDVGNEKMEGKIDQLWEIITTSTQMVSCVSFS